MKKAVVAVAISGLLGSCAALQELSGGPVIVAQEPIRLEGYATSYEGRCKGAAFAMRIREQGNVEREATGVSVTFAGRRRELPRDSTLVELLTQARGATRVILRCNRGLGSVSLYLTTALPTGGYSTTQATIDRRLEVELDPSKTVSLEEYGEYNGRRRSE
ncbi:MAG: hypothetical protein KY449_11725 [Proteobacteria bacterium]|nr:hypothetical protein [Pseudomonadota bacterium]